MHTTTTKLWCFHACLPALALFAHNTFTTKTLPQLLPAWCNDQHVQSKSLIPLPPPLPCLFMLKCLTTCTQVFEQNGQEVRSLSMVAMPSGCAHGSVFLKSCAPLSTYTSSPFSLKATPPSSPLPTNPGMQHRTMQGSGDEVQKWGNTKANSSAAKYVVP
jgi:hypothetical protein